MKAVQRNRDRELRSVFRLRLMRTTWSASPNLSRTKTEQAKEEGEKAGKASRNLAKMLTAL